MNDLPTPATKNFIVYINPFGGRGKANQIYEKRVKAMFAEAEIQHEVVKTGNLWLTILSFCKHSYGTTHSSE